MEISHLIDGGTRRKAILQTDIGGTEWSATHGLKFACSDLSVMEWTHTPEKHCSYSAISCGGATSQMDAKHGGDLGERHCLRRELPHPDPQLLLVAGAQRVPGPAGVDDVGGAPEAGVSRSLSRVSVICKRAVRNVKDGRHMTTCHECHLWTHPICNVKLYVWKIFTINYNQLLGNPENHKMMHQQQKKMCGH